MLHARSRPSLNLERREGLCSSMYCASPRRRIKTFKATESAFATGKACAAAGEALEGAEEQGQPVYPEDDCDLSGIRSMSTGQAAVPAKAKGAEYQAELSHPTPRLQQSTSAIDTHDLDAAEEVKAAGAVQIRGLPAGEEKPALRPGKRKRAAGEQTRLPKAAKASELPPAEDTAKVYSVIVRTCTCI